MAGATPGRILMALDQVGGQGSSRQLSTSIPTNQQILEKLLEVASKLQSLLALAEAFQSRNGMLESVCLRTVQTVEHSLIDTPRVISAIHSMRLRIASIDRKISALPPAPSSK